MHKAVLHKAVLLEEVVAFLNPAEGGTYVDATVGSGGHAEALLNRIGPRGKLIGLDRDHEALARSATKLSTHHHNYVLEHGNFTEMATILQERGVAQVDGILMDLGISSNQVDAPERGFSFSHDGPLDMRMDLSQELTAADIVNEQSVEYLIELFFTLGEERGARRVAKAIDAARREGLIETTAQLAEIVSKAKGGRRGKTHPATNTFRALRMAVNQELEAVQEGVARALELVKVGGRVAVITFHSSEDRVVKQLFLKHEGRWESLAEGGQRWVGKEPAVKRLTKKPLVPSSEELSDNTRARSAKLRVVERVR